MRITVFHGLYGCETGCCGHYIETDDPNLKTEFTFSHPYSDDPEDQLEYAKRLVADVYGDEHVKDLDWANCVISDD